MKNKPYEWTSMTKFPLMIKLMATALVIFANPLQAAEQSTPFKLSLDASPAGIAANTPSAAITISPTATLVKEITVNVNVPKTEAVKPVEVHIAAPTAQAPANVNIKLPDVNVSTPEQTNTNTKETIIEKTIEVQEKAPDEEPQNNNVMIVGIFGILALAIVAGFLVMRSKNDGKP